MSTPITTTTELEAPDPSPTVLALAQALATRDGEGAAFTSTTKSETSARIASEYIQQAQDIAKHLPAGQTPECDHAALVRHLAQSTVLSLASAEAVVHAATTWTAPAPAMKPDREDMVKALYAGRRSTWSTMPEDLKERWRKHADLILDELPGKTEAQVRAEALRDAADLARSYSNSPLDHAGHIAAILDERADEEVR